MVDIRAARPADAPAIFELIRALAAYEKLAHEVVGSAEVLSGHLFSDNPACEALVADTGSEVVGFALYFATYSTFLTAPGIHLEDLFVLPSERGKGIGKALLSALARETVKRGCGRLEWSVLDWNTPAIEFYRSLGAGPMEGWSTFRLAGPALEAFSA